MLFDAIKRILLVLVLALALGGLIAAAVLADRRSDAEDSARAESWHARTGDIYQELALLENEAHRLQHSLDESGVYPGSLNVLFTSPDALILSEILPIMDEYGYPATIAISENDFPGNRGCLTADDVRMLCDKGWDLCVTTDGDMDKLSALLSRMADAELPESQAVYFPNGDCDVSMEDSLKELGFEIVIQYNGNAPLNYDSEKLQLYYVMACGTRDSNYYTVQHAVTGRNCSLITIGFSDPREYYSADDLIEDLNYFAECEMNDEITVTNTADAYAAQRSYDEEYEETAAYTAVRSAEIAARVQELRSELSELTKLGKGHNP